MSPYPRRRPHLFMVAGALLAGSAAATEVPFSAENLAAGAFVATSVAPADLDGDGDLDLLGAGQDVRWWQNTAGDGSVWTEVTIDGTFSAAESARAADVDGDGDLDVVGVGGSGLAWWQNTAGDGSAWTQVTIEGTFSWLAVATGDVDGDGDLDVLATRGVFHTWWENTAGDGSAWTQVVIDSLLFGVSESVAAADLDGDGDLDVLGCDTTNNQILRFTNVSGDGSLWTRAVLGGGFAHPSSVASADVDGDGDLDVLGAASDGDALSWWENTAGDGTAWTGHSVATGFDGASSVAGADLDGDGDVDVLGAAADDFAISWWENTAGDGSAWTEYAVNSEIFVGAQEVAAGDVDADGDLDVLGAANPDNDIAWWANETIHRSAFFLSENRIGGLFVQASSVATADLDGDGDLDILGAADGSDRVTWWQNTAGDGSAWTEHVIDSFFNAASEARSADIDGDGDLDVIGAASLDDDVTWYENTAGDGSAWIEHTVDGDFDGAGAVDAADFDGDGDLDLVAGARFADDIAWYENTAGDGSAWVKTIIDPDFNQPRSVAAGDMDGDGDMDFVAGAHDGDTIKWWDNTMGDGSVWLKRNVALVFRGVQTVVAVDMDGDGDLDVLASGSPAHDILWWENTSGVGTGWSQHIVRLNDARGARWAEAADLDGDGDLDVLGANFDDDDIVWYENGTNVAGEWAARVIAGNFDGAKAVTAADLDGDGDLDVAGAAWHGNDISWWENRGGQFALATTDTAPAGLIAPGTEDDLLSITMSHLGIAGDHDEELATLDLLFEETAGDPLTTMEANATVKNVKVYLDDGSGVFEPGSDTLVATVADLTLTAGRLAVSLPDGDAGVQVPFGAPKTFFVALEFESMNMVGRVDTLRVTHVTTSTSTAEDRDADIPLSLEYVADVSSSLVDTSDLPVELMSFRID